MKIEYKTVSPERRIVTGMIVSDAVLSRVADKWVKGGLFRNEWANLIGQWCVDYHGKYGKAPAKDIVPLFEAWVSDGADEDLIPTVDKVLASLAGEYAKLAGEMNDQLVIDTAGKHFNRVGLEKFRDTLEGLLENDQVEKAMELKEKLEPIRLGPSEWTDVLRDKKAMRQAFKARGEPVIKLPGDLGVFFGQALERDAFIALYAPEKRGKSYILQELAWRAMLQGRRVAMFQCGDLSKGQFLLRLGVRASGHPMKRCEVRRPVSLTRDPDDPAGVVVEYKSKDFEEGLTWQAANKATDKVINMVRSKESLFRLSVHPNTTITIKGVDSILTRWSKDGFDADVVVIDYADILAPLDSKMDSRFSIDATWKYMRRISQERHCLVLTATQTDADSYDTDLIRKKNFSEDKRKYAHVTGTFAVNQTDGEKERGLFRFNWLQLRDGEFTESQVVHVAGCLAIANPMIRSCF